MAIDWRDLLDEDQIRRPFTKEKIAGLFQKNKNMKAVPIGRVPKEAWQMLLRKGQDTAELIVDMFAIRKDVYQRGGRSVKRHSWTKETERSEQKQYGSSTYFVRWGSCSSKASGTWRKNNGGTFHTGSMLNEGVKQLFLLNMLRPNVCTTMRGHTKNGNMIATDILLRSGTSVTRFHPRRTAHLERVSTT